MILGTALLGEGFVLSFCVTTYDVLFVYSVLK